MNDQTRNQFILDNIELVLDNSIAHKLYEVAVQKWLEKETGFYDLSYFKFEYSAHHESPEDILDRFNKHLAFVWPENTQELSNLFYSHLGLNHKFFSPEEKKGVLTGRLSEYGNSYLYSALKYAITGTTDVNWVEVNKAKAPICGQWVTVDLVENQPLEIKLFGNGRCDIKGLTATQIQRFLDLHELTSKHIWSEFERRK